jgi:hypothetical protein
MNGTESNGGDVDLFVMLARIGVAKGDCDSAAISHLEALAMGSEGMAGHEADILRKALERLMRTAQEALALFDGDRLAVHRDQYELDDPNFQTKEDRNKERQDS